MTIEVISNGEAITFKNIHSLIEYSFISRSILYFENDAASLKILKQTNPFDYLTILLTDLDDNLFPTIADLINVLVLHYDYNTLIENLVIGDNDIILTTDKTPLDVNVMELIGGVYVSISGFNWSYVSATKTLTISINVNVPNAK